MTYTTIQVSMETKERLKTQKITKRESYDEIINRIISKFDKITGGIEE